MIQKNEIGQLKDELKFMRATFQTSPYVCANYLVPTGQTWNKESYTKYGLCYKEKSYNVTSSSTYSVAPDTHSPNWLLDGKKENEGGKRWASDANLKSAFIQIKFDTQHIANILKMSSRDQFYSQSPTSFEIFGVTGNSEISLRKFENVLWLPNETKLFAFFNIQPFNCYKIVFYTAEKHFALAELNIGKVVY